MAEVARRPASAASGDSTRSSSGSSAVRHALCGAGLPLNRLRQTGAVSVQLGYRPPYDWAAMLAFLRARAIPGVEAVSGGRYVRTIAIAGEHGVGRGASRRLRARASLSDAFSRIGGAAGDHRARSPRVRSCRRPAGDRRASQPGPMLAPLVAARPGLRVPGAWDGFELAVRAMLGQQITVSAATRLVGKLVALLRRVAEPAAARPEGLTQVFPTPRQLAGADLAAIGMPRARANRAVLAGGGCRR